LYIGKTFCNAQIDPDTPIVINFDDGFILDEEATAAKDLQLVNSGILNPYEYRMKHFGEDEETAKAKLNEMQTQTNNPFSFA
jgi:hypothetical protein